MWNFESSRIENGQLVHTSLHREGQPISYQSFLNLLESSHRFRAAFIETLSAVPFVAYRWEMPPVTEATLGRPCEFVVINSPDLMVRSDPQSFRDRFLDVEAGEVLVFPNLGGDATLIVPTPVSESDFAHIAAFTQNAPIDLQHQLWQTVGTTLNRLIDPEPLWLSTAGGGVAWLHVRIDQMPKYYQYNPFRSANMV